jgi:tRNA dimethylallyltransferase
MRSEDSLLPSIALFVGATAAGKSAAGLHYCSTLNGELINADSVQLYRRLDIGSAKASAKDRAIVRHHLLDLLDPDQQSDAGYYCSVASPAIDDARSRGKIPFVVGGTGLYARALVRGLAQGIPSDAMVRKALNDRAASSRDELALMHQELAQIDPTYASKISHRDPIRVVRALEVWQLTGITLSAHHAMHAQQPPRYRALWIGVEVDRAVLRARVEARTRQMFRDGWYDEVRALLQDYPPETRSLQSVGYAEVVAAVVAKAPVDEALVTAVINSTMAFAKRQRTWFRGERDVRWVTVDTLLSSAFSDTLKRWFEGSD